MVEGVVGSVVGCTVGSFVGAIVGTDWMTFSRLGPTPPTMVGMAATGGGVAVVVAVSFPREEGEGVGGLTVGSTGEEIPGVPVGLLAGFPVGTSVG